jgi:signal recognition particle subunit SRP54
MKRIRKMGGLKGLGALFGKGGGIPGLGGGGMGGMGGGGPAGLPGLGGGAIPPELANLMNKKK